jgi:enediyne biosynthesis protein E4
MLDYDNDGDLDVLVADGHILDNIELFTPALHYAQRMLAYRNDGGGRFTEEGAALGPALGQAIVGRGLAVADYDHDGDMDVAVTCNNGPFRLLQNVGGASLGHSVEVMAIGSKSGRDAIGARITVVAEGLRSVRSVQPSGSYQSSSDRVVHFGLGKHEQCQLTIRWPSGQEESFPQVAAGQLLTVIEGKGITARQPFRTRNAGGGGPRSTDP